MPILRLIRSKNIGPVNFFKLISQFGSAKKALDHLPISNVCSEKEAIQELKELEQYGGKYITYNDPKYPELLKEIHSPPPFISYVGNIDLLSKDICAIVGSRNASFHGLRFAGEIAKKLAKKDVAIASGLANGIDAAAHKGAISNTIAVIAGGIDQIYPAFHENLYREIAKNGLILAESRIGTSPTPHCFPKRNRIIAGLAKITLVVEAALKSGSLITARCAMESNRDVGAVPGYPMDFRSRGPNSLIRDGAIMVESADDILEALGKSYEEQDKENPYKKGPNKGEEGTNRHRILSLLSAEPVSMNDICDLTNLSIPAVCEVLIPEEIEGNIVRVQGNKFALPL